MIAILDKVWGFACWLPLINLCVCLVGNKVGVSQRVLLFSSYCVYWIVALVVGLEFCQGWGRQKSWKMRILMVALLFVLIFELLELYFDVALWTYCRKYFGFADFHLRLLVMFLLSVAVGLLSLL